MCCGDDLDPIFKVTDYCQISCEHIDSILILMNLACIYH